MNNKGVYLIQNLTNGKGYVGSSNNLKNRVRTHKSELKRNKHGNIYLQYSYNKYGIDNFSISVLEYVEEESNLTKKELEWILRLRTNEKEYGYNMCLPNPEYKLGTGKLFEESKEKIRRSIYKYNYGETSEEDYTTWKENVYHSPSNDPNYIPPDRTVLVMDKITGKVLEEYANAKELSDKMGIRYKLVQNILHEAVYCKGKKRQYYKGYKFIYKREYEPDKDYTYVRKGKCKIAQLDCNFNVISIFDGVVIASKALNISESKINTSIFEKCKTEGYYFRKIDKDNNIDLTPPKRRKEIKPVEVVLPSGEVLTFDSTSEGMKYFSIDKSKLKYIKNGIRKGDKRYGNLWRYKNS